MATAVMTARIGSAQGRCMQMFLGFPGRWSQRGTPRAGFKLGSAESHGHRAQFGYRLSHAGVERRELRRFVRSFPRGLARRAALTIPLAFMPMNTFRPVGP